MNEAAGLRRARRRALWIFGCTSLVTILLGAVVMAQDAVPPGILVRNSVAWLVAGAIAIFLAQRGWLGGWAAPVALAVVALTFLGPGQEGVHRWLGLGPVQLNGAALVLPLAIVVFARAHAIVAAISFVLIAALLAWQPDISQLAGFAIAALVLGAARFGWPGAALSAAIAAAAIALCLSRPDPLEPVAHVEGVFALAWSQSPAIALAMGLTLAGAALTPLMMGSAHPLGAATPLALAAYLTATAVAPFLGPYPVPLAGYGLSFVLGWWLAFAALCAPPGRNPSPRSATAAIP